MPPGLYYLNIAMKSGKSLEREEEAKFTELPYNHEETLRLEASPLYLRYKNWLKENGVVVDPRIRYPSYFGAAGRGVVGVSASKPIEKGRAVVAVPYKLLITVDKVREDKQMDAIVSSHLLSYGRKDDLALKILILYVTAELLKGEKSHYFPYFSICTSSYMAGWGNMRAYKVEHRAVTAGLKAMQEEIDREFINFLRIFRTNEKVFPQNLNNAQYREAFERAYSFITTRAFGWSLPSISLIPLADSLNHGNARYLNHFVTNIDLEKSPACKELKFRSKVNLAILRDEYFTLNNEELNAIRREPKSRALRFVEKHSEILAQSQKLLGESDKNIGKGGDIRKKQLHILHQQYKAGIHKLKDLHFYQSSCTEDNDTDEDQVYERAHHAESFELDDLERAIPDSKKKSEVKKYWKLYYDNEESEEEEEEMEESLPRIKGEAQRVKMEIEDKLHKEEESSELEDEESDDEQEFEWVWEADHARTYFVMNTKEVVRENEQIYNFYGRRSNKFLLLGYNFVLNDNAYDSFPLRLKLDDRITTRVPASKLLEPNKKDANLYTREIRLKRYRINKDLINLCRTYVILWTKKEWKNCRICLPFDREVEQKTLELYEEFITHFQKEYTTSIEEDEAEEEECTNYEERLAATLRIEYKKILQGQAALLAKCQLFLKKWKPNQQQDFAEADMKWVKRAKPYLIALEKATSL